MLFAAAGLLWVAPSLAVEGLVYSSEFEFSTTYCPGDTQYDDWLAFRECLPSEDVLGIRVSGSLDEVGRSCADPILAQRLVDAMRTRANISLQCDGNTRAVGSNCQIGCGRDDNDRRPDVAGCRGGSALYTRGRRDAEPIL